MNDLNYRTYTEMIAEAKKIHPDMQVRVTDFGDSQWEMFMPTAFHESHELPDEYKGTAAWTQYEDYDSKYDNALQRYRHNAGLDSIPLEGVAEVVNLKAEQQQWGSVIQQQLHSMAGTDFGWDGEVTNEQFSAYRNVQAKVAQRIEAEFAEKWAALEKKWGF